MTFRENFVQISQLATFMISSKKPQSSQTASPSLLSWMVTWTGQKWSHVVWAMSIKLGCMSIRLREEPEAVELQPARRARMRGQAWQGVRGKMEKVWGAAREEENQARGELRKYWIYCRPYLGHFHLLEGKDRGDWQTGPDPWTAFPTRRAFNKMVEISYIAKVNNIYLDNTRMQA